LVRGEGAPNILRFSSKKLQELENWFYLYSNWQQKNSEANMEEAGLFVKTITVMVE
jgi:large subunit ribosomal protein L22